MNHDTDFQLILEQGWNDLQAFAAGDTSAPLRLHASLHASASRLYQLHSDGDSESIPSGVHESSPSGSSSRRVHRMMAVQALAPQLLLRVCALQWPSGHVAPNNAEAGVPQGGGADSRKNTLSSRAGGGTDIPASSPTTAPVIPSSVVILVAMVNAAYISQVISPCMMRSPPHSRPLQVEELLLLYSDVLSRTTSLSLLSPYHFTEQSPSPPFCRVVALPEMAERQLVLCCSLLLLLLRDSNKLVPSIENTFSASRVGAVGYVLLTLQLWGMTLDVLKDPKRLDIGGVRRTQLRCALHQRVDLLLELTEEALRYFLAVQNRSGSMLSGFGVGVSGKGKCLFTSHVFLRAPPIQVLLHAMQFMNHGVVFPLVGYRLKNNCVNSMSEMQLSSSPPKHPLQRLLQDLPHRLVWQWATHSVASSISPRDKDSLHLTSYTSSSASASTDATLAVSFISAALRLCMVVDESTVELLHSSLLLSIHLQSPYRRQLQSSPPFSNTVFTSVSIRGILYNCTILSAIMENAGKSILLLEDGGNHNQHNYDSTGEKNERNERLYGEDHHKWRGKGGMHEGGGENHSMSGETISPSLLPSLLPSLFSLLSEASETLLFVLQRAGCGNKESVKSETEEVREGDEEEEADAVRAACEAINCLVEELSPDPIPAFHPTDDLEDYEETVTVIRAVNEDKEAIRKKLYSFFVACQEAIGRCLEQCVVQTIPLRGEGKNRGITQGGERGWNPPMTTMGLGYPLCNGDGYSAGGQCSTTCRTKKREELMEGLEIISNSIISGEDLHEVSLQNHIVALWVTYERLYELLHELPSYLTLSPSSLSCGMTQGVQSSGLDMPPPQFTELLSLAGFLPRLPSCHALLQYYTLILPFSIQQEVQIEQRTKDMEGMKYNGSGGHIAGTGGGGCAPPTSLQNDNNSSDSCVWRSIVLAEAVLFPAVVHRLLVKEMGGRPQHQLPSTMEGHNTCNGLPNQGEMEVFTLNAADGNGGGGDEGILKCLILVLRECFFSFQQYCSMTADGLSRQRSCWTTGGVGSIPPDSQYLEYWRLASSIARSLSFLCRRSTLLQQQRDCGMMMGGSKTFLWSWKEAAAGLATWLETSFPLPPLQNVVDPHFPRMHSTADTVHSFLYGYFLDLSFALGNIEGLLDVALKSEIVMISRSLMEGSENAHNPNSNNSNNNNSALSSSAAVCLVIQLFFCFPPLDGVQSVVSLLTLVSNGIMEAAQWASLTGASFFTSSPVLLMGAAAALEGNFLEGEKGPSGDCQGSSHHRNKLYQSNPISSFCSMGLFGSTSLCSTLPSDRFYIWVKSCIAPRLKDVLLSYFGSLPQGAATLADLLKQWWKYHLWPSGCTFPPHFQHTSTHNHTSHTAATSCCSLSPADQRASHLPYGKKEGSSDSCYPGAATVHWRLVGTLLAPLSSVLPPPLRISLVVDVLRAFAAAFQRGILAIRTGGRGEGGTEGEVADLQAEEEEILVKEVAVILPQLFGVDAMEAIRSCVRSGEWTPDSAHHPILSSPSSYSCCTVLLPLLQAVATLCESFGLFCLTSRPAWGTAVSGIPFSSCIPTASSPLHHDIPSSEGENNITVSSARSGGPGRDRRLADSIITPAYFVLFSTLLHLTSFLFETLPYGATPPEAVPPSSCTGIREDGECGGGGGGVVQQLHNCVRGMRGTFSSVQEMERWQIQYWRGEVEESAMAGRGRNFALGDQGGGPGMFFCSSARCDGGDRENPPTLPSLPSCSSLTDVLLEWLKSFFSLFFWGLQCWLLTKGGNTILSLCNGSGHFCMGSPSGGGISGSPSYAGEQEEEDSGEDGGEWGGISSPFSPSFSPSSRLSSAGPFSEGKEAAPDTVLDFFRKDLSILGSIVKVVFPQAREVNMSSSPLVMSYLTDSLLVKLRHNIEESIFTPGFAHLDRVFPEGREKVNFLLDSFARAVDFYDRQSILSRAL